MGRERARGESDPVFGASGRHPAELKKLDDAQEDVHARDLDYSGWKAAKDIVDLAFLADLEVDRKRWSRLLDGSNLRTYAEREWARRDKDLLAIGDRIRENHGEATSFVAARFDKVLDLLSS